MNYPLYCVSAVGIAGLCWLLGVHPAMSVLAGLGLALSISNPRFRGTDWAEGRAGHNPVPAQPSDLPLPSGGLPLAVPLGAVIGLAAALLLGSNLVGCAFAVFAGAALCNCLRSLFAGDACGFAAFRWTGRWTRVDSPLHYWGSVVGDCLLALCCVLAARYYGFG